MLLFSSIYTFAQKPNDTRVLLQGFYWESAANNPNNWYNIVNAKASEISAIGIDMIWLPPPSDAGSTEGYLPRQLNNFSNSYGNLAAHQNMLNNLNANGIDPIADIVINHRVGTASWMDFTNPQWGTDAVTSNDEVWSQPQFYNTYPRGGNDTGTPYEAARDIDHTKTYIQNSIIGFLNNLKTLGYKGWRYDFVHGFSKSYFTLYNNSTNPTFSVGEYYSSDKQTIQNWIDGNNSTAFDFPTYFTLKSVVKNNNYSYLAYQGAPSGGIGWDARNNTTFVENHDTPRYDTPNNVLNTGNVAQTYAYLMTHPGVPCIYWPHLFDWGTTVKTKITELVQIRKQAGIHSQSAVSVQTAQTGVYASIITGTNYDIAMKMGPSNWSPSGNNWTLAASGNNYTVWKKTPVAPPITFTVFTQNYSNIYSWDANLNPTNGAWPGAAMTNIGNGWFSAIVTSNCSNLIFSNNGNGQSADLNACTDKPYYYDNAWHANLPTTNTFSVFVQGFTHLYSWDSNQNATNGVWPGVVMTTNANGWKTAAVIGPCSNLIFSNNGSGQTANLNACNDKPYFYNNSWHANAPVANSFTVHVQGYTHIYTWNTNLNATNGAWPGGTMTNNGNGWYSKTISGTCSNLIFSNNGGNQTNNLYACNDKTYYYNGQWNTNPPSNARLSEDSMVEQHAESISLYPNPFRNRLTLSLDLQQKENSVLVEIDNLNGEKKIIYQKTLGKGKQDITIDSQLNTLRSSFYVCRITINETVHVKKLVKL